MAPPAAPRAAIAALCPQRLMSPALATLWARRARQGAATAASAAARSPAAPPARGAALVARARGRRKLFQDDAGDDAGPAASPGESDGDDGGVPLPPGAEGLADFDLTPVPAAAGGGGDAALRAVAAAREADYNELVSSGLGSIALFRRQLVEDLMAPGDGDGGGRGGALSAARL